MKYPYINNEFLVRWSSLPIDSIKADVEHALEIAESRISQIEQIPINSVTYENTALALEESSHELDQAWSIVEHLTNVMDSEELRNAYKSVLPEVTAFYSGICLRPALWQVVRSLSQSEQMNNLKPVQVRYVNELVEDFLECGAGLEEQDRNRIKEIESELAEITQRYSENVLDSTNDWELIIDDSDLLSDLPDVLKNIAFADAISKGKASEEDPKWRFTLHAPSIVPFMKYVKDESLRKKAWLASCEIGKKGKWDNTNLILQIITLRQEKANILGHDNFSNMVLKRRMAKNGENARDFVKKLKSAVGKTISKEVHDIEVFQSEQLGLSEVEQVEPWNVAYWSEKMIKEQYSFDDELLRPFFSIDSVLSGLFDIAGKIFGLKIVERETTTEASDSLDKIEVWTKEVQYYDVYDYDTDSHLGGFYTDWFPRETKRSGAWMDSIRSGVFGEDGKIKEKALGIMCGNMTPGSDGKPALLSHDEVETIFHEFGHLIHELCGEVEVKSLNGITVPWDFVELPSQILENWCWQRASLDLFARHIETGKVIDQELFAKMQKTRNFQKGLATMRQLSFGIMDLDLHIDFNPKTDLDTFVEGSIKSYQPQWKSPSSSIIRRFGHLFSSSVGYAAGYYSYQWSEVLEADAFGLFLEQGILDPDTGRKFRKEILSVGNSIDAMQAYENFRGRKPTLEAYLERADMEVTQESKQEFGV